MVQNPAPNLDRIANWYTDPQGLLQGWQSVHRALVHYRYQSMADLVQQRDILELGVADGEMTRYFLQDCTSVTGVDGAPHFLAACAAQFREAVDAGRLRLTQALFEEFETTQRWPVVVASHILEHLDEPIAALQRFGQWLQQGGRLLVSVPNAQSLHRLVAVKMGLLPAADSLNEQDVALGHRRVYSAALLHRHVEAAGLTVLETRGILLKPLANRQMEGVWSQPLLDGFYALGKDMPQYCAELLVVCARC